MLGQNRLVFLKITWRPDSPYIATETERYADLHAARVPNIPHLLSGYDTCHDLDVAADAVDSDGNKALLRTRSHEFLNVPDLLARVQTRIVYETLGLRLDEYQEPSALVKVVCDALAGTDQLSRNSVHTNICSSPLPRVGESEDSSPRHQCREYTDRHIFRRKVPERISL